MDNVGFMQMLPTWLTFLGTVVIVVLSIMCGVAIARLRRERAGKDEDSSVNTVAGATLGLLAFILAFTFGFTASRYDMRRQMLLDEVNAVETTYLRTGFIPEPHCSEVRRLIREYVAVRADLVKRPQDIVQAIAKSEDLQGRLWRHATAVAGADLKNQAIVALFMDSLNQMIDLHTKRVTVGTVYRIPPIMWLALFGLTVISMIEVGYLFGKSDNVNWLFIFALALAFSAVILLIADLDRSGSGKIGIIQVNPKPMLDLQQRLSADKP